MYFSMHWYHFLWFILFTQWTAGGMVFMWSWLQVANFSTGSSCGLQLNTDHFPIQMHRKLGLQLINSTNLTYICEICIVWPIAQNLTRSFCRHVKLVFCHLFLRTISLKSVSICQHTGNMSWSCTCISINSYWRASDMSISSLLWVFTGLICFCMFLQRERERDDKS